jgi:signal transduction histidine kinase
MHSLMPYLARRGWLLPLAFVVCAGSTAVNRGDPVPIVLGIAAALSVFAVDLTLAAVLVNGLLVGAYFAAGGDNGPIFFTIPAATLIAAWLWDVRRWLPYVLGAGVLVWAGLLVRGLRHDDLEISAWQSVGVGALVAAAAAVATSVRARRAAQRDRLDRVAADEKLRMAQDLHDGVGHGLAVIAMQAGVALHVMDKDPAKARVSLEAIRDTSRQSLEALRAELAAMAGPGAGAGGGAQAPRRPAPGPADLPALLDRIRAAGLRVELVGDTRDVPEPLGETVYGVVQEALTNVLRHARATSVTVRVERRDAVVEVAVTDDGRGGTVQDEGMGISGMRARVAALGGTLRVGPCATGGFEVAAELPG